MGCEQVLNKTVTFGSRTLVGIQAADLLAREIMKHFDNMIGPVKRPERRSMSALRKTKRVGCDLHAREVFEDFRRQFDEVSAKTGVSAETYGQWLRENRQADSMSSRHRYLIELEKERPAAPAP